MSEWIQILLVIMTSLSVILCIFLLVQLSKVKEDLQSLPRRNEDGIKLKLQALERLTLFAERCRLSSLVARVEGVNLPTADYYIKLIETIKEEYEYNLTQQVYVSPEIWNAITKLKDQNMYVIHQITSNLPPHATLSDLGKLILEYCNTPNADLSNVVLDGLQYETKQLLS